MEKEVYYSRIGWNSNKSAALSGIGITSDTIKAFMSDNNLDPLAYNQLLDALNDHSRLVEAINYTSLTYFANSIDDNWLLFSPAVLPSHMPITVPTIDEIKNEIVNVITDLYQVPASLQTELRKYVDWSVGLVDGAANYEDN